MERFESECPCKILFMKIAIVKLSAFGDIIHAMVVLQFIKKHNEEIEIDWIVEKSFKELLENNPDINKIHVIDIRQAKMKKSICFLFNELRKVRRFGKYDLVIDMQGLIKSALVARLIPSTKTLGFDRPSSREGISSLFYDKTFKYAYNKNIIERNLAIINFALGASYSIDEIQDKLPFLFSNSNKLKSIFSTSKKNILLIPGASVFSKRYAPYKLAKLTTLIDADFHILWGSEDEKKIAKEIKAAAPDVNICEKLSINSLILLISQVDLVIGPDTGPTHMAWACNKPSITLFGPTPGFRNSLVTNVNKIIESESEVNPFEIDNTDHSINNIEESDIANLAKNLL
jgi:heptosyltransferase I